MREIKHENGFTLLEVLAVIAILAVLGAIVAPKLGASTANARMKADMATAHEVKAALDRYQMENGTYPKDLSVDKGSVVCASLIPKYIGKLDKSTIQQTVSDDEIGFGLGELTPDEADKTQYVISDTEDNAPTNTIMIYLSDDNLAAEVSVYDEGFDKILWTSAD